MRAKQAFVIMPFSPTASQKNWTEVFEEVFRPALEDCGYCCTRAEIARGRLIASIVEALLEADLVIADVTDRNANVFYELGVRHSLRRGTIIVSQGTEHIPSDLSGYWCLPYGLGPADVRKFKAEIKRILEKIDERPDGSDNPVADYLDQAHMSSSRQVNRDNVKKLGALLTELSGNRLAIQQWTSENPYVISVGCIELLIQTLYVDVGPDLLKICYELAYKLELLRRGKVDHEILQPTLTEIEAVYKRIWDVRQRIVSGDFAEPATVSMMMWS